MAFATKSLALSVQDFINQLQIEIILTRPLRNAFAARGKVIFVLLIISGSRSRMVKFMYPNGFI
jgi:hypothetical protein